LRPWKRGIKEESFNRVIAKEYANPPTMPIPTTVTFDLRATNNESPFSALSSSFVSTALLLVLHLQPPLPMPHHPLHPIQTMPAILQRRVAVDLGVPAVPIRMMLKKDTRNA
jgi:hypothetical protein